MNEPDSIKKILAMNTIAVVGLSPRAGRPSNNVARYLDSNDYTIVPVNPGQNKILGKTAYPNLKSIPYPVDLVDVFRRPEFVGPIVDEAIAIGAKAIWLQDGVINHEAAAKAEKAGILVIMDDCILRHHQAQSDPEYVPHCEI